jgi:2-oxo-3-hexenedioate decarboxylase
VVTAEHFAVDAAATLDAARRDIATLSPFSAQHPDLDMTTAYAVAHQLRVLRYEKVVGRKVGFTNRTIWDRYGVHQPIWGWMYEGTVANAGGQAAHVLLADLCQPRVEPEVVLGLSAPLRGTPGVGECAAAVGWLAFGFEVVHCHYPGWRFTAVDAVMDGGLHGALRIGERCAPWGGWEADLATFTLALVRDGAVIDTGTGANVLDSPLHALAHLVRLAGSEGLAAGEIVTTGTITDAAPAAPGERYTVIADGVPLRPFPLHCR